jgi:CO dehydrogenase maturation factor
MSAALKRDGHGVVAIDADPDSNLLGCLGHPDSSSVRPLVELKELIEERTGAKPGTTGGMFRLNPFVDDIPDEYAVEVAGVKVLVVGAVKKGGAGCYCPENSFLRALVSHLLTGKNDDLVLDMEAGIEHLSRGTVRCVDHLLVVVDPGRRSVETALRIKKLASELGLARVGVVANKVRSEGDTVFLREALGDLEICGTIPYDDAVRDADIQGESVVNADARVKESIDEIMRYLENQQ